MRGGFLANHIHMALLEMLNPLPTLPPGNLLALMSRMVRMLRQEDLAATGQVEALYAHLFENRAVPTRILSLTPMDHWDIFELRQAFDVAEELIVQYVGHFYDARVIPVTYYKRERRVRRHLDQQCSALFKELIRRAGKTVEPELVIEEPIYCLEQVAREKRFPKSRDGKPNLATLRSRLHLELSRLIDTGPDSRRVLLPYEIR
jgi:hypothetical protein